jgi:UDP-galactopyranose mutase
VVSTPVADFVRHYGDMPGVEIAYGRQGFVRACQNALNLAAARGAWLGQSDAILAELSWDRTFGDMAALIAKMLARTGHWPRATAPTEWPVAGADIAGAPATGWRRARDPSRRSSNQSI